MQTTQTTPPLNSERLGGRELARKFGMNLRTFKECCIDGSKLPDPTDLYQGLWYEGELCALYADTNVGKSILAVQMANAISELGFKVLYVDLELSDKGVESRSRTEDGAIYEFSPNFYRLTIDYSLMLHNLKEIDDEGFTIIDSIEAVGSEENIDVLIIDNLTALCAGIESGESAVKIVNRLLKLRDDKSWSIMFLTHTPKLDKSMPITRDSMGGSKRLISLIDSAFAIGEVVGDNTKRYIKQTKVRMAECKYHENNVLLCKIDRVDGLLGFQPIGTAKEMNLLRRRDENVEKFNEDVLRLHRQGMSQRDIAAYLKCTRNRVRVVLENEKDTDIVKNIIDEEKSLF